MSRVLTNEQNYYDIADTIRQMKEVNTTYKPREMSSALKDIYSNEVEGTLPLTFQANGNNLLNYRIDGASGGVGDRTKNLFDAKNSTYGDGTYWNNSGNLNPNNTYYGSNVIDVTSGETITRSYTGTSANYFMRKDGSTVNVANSGSRNDGVTIIVPDDCIRYVFNIVNSQDPNNIQVVVGSQLPEIYEPYGYKVPVRCGGTTTNIYLDEPIGANESISLSDTEVDIPTIEGTNVLTIDTTVQPSNVYIQAPKDSDEIIEIINTLEEI